MSDHFNGLTPREAELLALLAEECGEVVQAIGKILRHGLESRHPNGGPTNRNSLGIEIGNVLAAVKLAEEASVVSRSQIILSEDRKLREVRQYLHHQSDEPVQP